MTEPGMATEHFLEVETVEGAGVAIDWVEDGPMDRLLRFRVEDLTMRWKYRLTIVDPLAKPGSSWLNPRYAIVSEERVHDLGRTPLFHDGVKVADAIVTRAGYPVECIAKIERMPDFDWEEVSL
jgi:hypothetical protein